MVDTIMIKVTTAEKNARTTTSTESRLERLSM